MKKGIIILVFLSTLIFGISCQKQVKTIEPILQQAKAILDQNPDSSLIILNKIANAPKLKKELYYQYLMLEIQAKYKSYEDITADTIIFDVRDYYLEKEDRKNAILATFYCGRVYEEQKKYEKALLEFLQAESGLEKSADYDFKGLCQGAIGKMYYKQFLDDKAITRYKLADKYYNKAGNHKNQIIANKFIANCFLSTENRDSALFYYEKALLIADANEIKEQQIGVRQGLGIYYRQAKDWEKSVFNFNQAMELASDSLQRAKLASNLARVYELKGDEESAILHLKQAMELMSGKGNNALLATIYKTWSLIEVGNSNFKSALDKYQLYSKYFARIINDNKNSALLEIEAKYNSQVIEVQNKQLKLQRLRLLIIFLVIILILAVIIIIGMVRASKREQRLKDAEIKIEKMQKMSLSYNEKDNSYRNLLIRHFQILRKTALIEEYLVDSEKPQAERFIKKFNEVVYDHQKINWDIMFTTINKASNGLFERMKNKFPHLDDFEFRVGCLIYCDFSNTEIALLLKYKINTIEVKKSSIRKKLGIKRRGNIKEFMEKSLRAN